VIDQWENFFDKLGLKEKQKEALYARLAIYDTAIRTEYEARSWDEYIAGCTNDNRHYTIISLHKTILMCKETLRKLRSTK